MSLNYLWLTQYRGGRSISKRKLALLPHRVAALLQKSRGKMTLDAAFPRSISFAELRTIKHSLYNQMETAR